MSEHAKSEQACPVCGQHALALDRPPEIDVMGVQAYSDMLGMGDLHPEAALGIVCLNCKTFWRDKAAFDRGEPESEVVSDDSDVGADETNAEGDDSGE